MQVPEHKQSPGCRPPVCPYEPCQCFILGGGRSAGIEGEADARPVGGGAAVGHGAQVSSAPIFGDLQSWPEPVSSAWRGVMWCGVAWQRRGARLCVNARSRSEGGTGGGGGCFWLLPRRSAQSGSPLSGFPPPMLGIIKASKIWPEFERKRGGIEPVSSAGGRRAKGDRVGGRWREIGWWWGSGCVRERNKPPAAAVPCAVCRSFNPSSDSRRDQRLSSSLRAGSKGATAKSTRRSCKVAPKVDPLETLNVAYQGRRARALRSDRQWESASIGSEWESAMFRGTVGTARNFFFRFSNRTRRAGDAQHSGTPGTPTDHDRPQTDLEWTRGIPCQVDDDSSRSTPVDLYAHDKGWKLRLHCTARSLCKSGRLHRVL